jgi:hypothetical protein
MRHKKRSFLAPRTNHPGDTVYFGAFAKHAAKLAVKTNIGADSCPFASKNLSVYLSYE